MLKIENVTFIIKSFMRPGCLERLISSIRIRYPDVDIMVADDGPEIVSRNDAKVFNLPFDTGLSYGRNYLVDRVSTEYFLLMDDDHVFEDSTKVEKLLHPLKHGPFDLVGAQVLEAAGPFPWQGLMEIDGTCLTMKPGNRGEYEATQKVDFCHNFFAAKTEAIRRVRWDDTFKMGEHTDFFLRAMQAGLSIGYRPDVRVFHAPEKSGEYGRFRNRAKTYRLEMMRKHGLTKISNQVFAAGNLDLDAPPAA